MFGVSSLSRAAGLLALLISAVSHAAGPAECASDSCASLGNEVAVYDCLEPKVTTLSPACRAAVYKVNPSLQGEMEVRSECAPEVSSLCPKQPGSLVESCLEDHYRQVGERCMKKLLDSNSAFVGRVAKDKKDAELAAEAAAKEAARKKELAVAEHKAYVKEKKAEASAERQDERWKECSRKLAKEFKDPTHPAIDGFCSRYSKIPEPKPAQQKCMDDLVHWLSPGLRTKDSQKIGAETDAWRVCGGKKVPDAEFMSCAKKRFGQGKEFLLGTAYCFPEHLRCMADLTGGKSDDGLFHDLCLSYEKYYVSLDDCANEQLDFWMDFFQQPEDGEYVQQEITKHRAWCAPYLDEGKENAACVRDLLRKHPQLRYVKKSNLPGMVSFLCTKPEAYRECVIPRFFALEGYIQVLGYPSSQFQQKEIDEACTLKAALAAPAAPPVPGAAKTADDGSGIKKKPCP